jgi:hypothetical protein
MTVNFEVEKIHDSIWVFKKAYKYGKELINYYESLPPFENEAENWEGWYAFGDHRRIFTPGPTWESFPSKESFDKVFDGIENEAHKNFLIKEVLDLYYYSTKIYAEDQNINLPNWKWEAFDIASYTPGAGAGIDHGMPYHTDFQHERHDEPGVKFGFTCLFYLNDEYSGGEIIFKELSDDLQEVVWRGSYKPSAGDIVIFPAKHPIYHATRKCEDAKKYILRLYWRYEDEGAPSYWEEKAKYEKEDEWELYLKEKRKRVGFERGQLINNSDSELNGGVYGK